MKARLKLTSFASAFASVVVSCVAAAASGAAEAKAAQPPSTATPQPKTHTLFMGADVSVLHGKELYRVQDVAGSSFIIKVKGEDVRIRTDWKSLNLQIVDSLKLSETTASVKEFSAERAYTSGADPFHKFVRESGAAAGAAAAADLALNEVLNIEKFGYAPPPSSEGKVDPLVAAKANYETMLSQTLDSRAQVGTYATELQQQTADENFDAIRVSFSVASEKPLTRPYIVLVTEFREKDSKPGTARRWVYAKSLEPIDAKPRKIHVRQGGFPAGFTLESCRMHLFNDGQEVPTDVSAKRIALSRDEAIQYQIIDYIGRNKGATLPAAPAVDKLTREQREKIVPGELSRTYYVRVGKDGKVLAAFSDQAARKTIADARLDALLKSVPFKPALEQGKPVEAIAPLKLGQLSASDF